MDIEELKKVGYEIIARQLRDSDGTCWIDENGNKNEVNLSSAMVGARLLIEEIVRRSK